MPKDPYPPMTAVELRALYEANKTREMARALWEIARLRDQVLHFYSLAGVAKINSPAAGSIAETALRSLEKEPCVIEEDEKERKRKHIPYSKYFGSI